MLWEVKGEGKGGERPLSSSSSSFFSALADATQDKSACGRARKLGVAPGLMVGCGATNARGEGGAAATAVTAASSSPRHKE